MAKNNILLKVTNVNKTFKSGRSVVKANNNISFELKQGEVLGVIGESGSGKTTLGRTIINLHTADSGSIKLFGKEIAGKKLSKKQKKYMYDNIQMIFQDPYSSLNEQKNIMSIISESLSAKNKDWELLRKYTHNRKDVLYYFENELKEAFYKEYWKYRHFANEVAVTGLKDVLEALNNFKVSDRIMNDNFERFINEVYDIKSIANYKIMNKLDDLIDFTIDEWKNRQTLLKTNGFTFEDEKILMKSQKNLKKAKQEKQYSKTTWKSKVKVDELIKEKESAENERDADLTRIKFEYKTVINNFKSKISLKKHDKAESMSISGYNYNSLLIERDKTGIVLFKNAMKSKVKSEPLFINEFLNKEYEKALGFSNESIIDEKFMDEEKLIHKLGKVLSKNDICSKHQIKINAINKKLEIENDKFNKLKKVDSKRDVSKMDEQINKLQKAVDKNVEEFDKNLVIFKEKSIVTIEEMNNKGAAKAVESEENIKKMREEISSLEKSIVFDKILKLDNFDHHKNKNISVARKKIKNSYKKNIRDNKLLELEIKVSMKSLTTIKGLYNILSFSQRIFRKTKLKAVFVRQEIFNTLVRVGLSKTMAYRYPHEFSGGMRQRVGIARALISKPKLIIADEPIAALDLSIQAQVVNLLMELKEEEGLSLIFIAHDLAMVEHNSDRVLIMHQGRVVEYGETTKIFKKPVHPYTRSLIDSIPSFSDLNKPFISREFDPAYLKEYKVFNYPTYFKLSEDHHILGLKSQVDVWKKNGK